MTSTFAIIGAGRMGTVHARTLAGHSDLDLVAIVEPNTAHGAVLAAELGIRHVETAEQLLEADKPDAVLIASPTPTHPELVRWALDHDLHVLCEKPLSLDPATGQALVELARERSLVLQVGFWRRFSPPWATAKRLLDEDAIGRPLMLRLSQWDAAPPPPAFCDPAVSGGLAIDCGVHEFDLAEWFTGERVTAVTAWNLPIVDHHIGAAGDVDNLVAVLSLAGGTVATIDLSRNAGYGDDVRTEILGERGAILIDLLPSGRVRLATGDGIEDVPDGSSHDAFEAGLRNQLYAFSAAITDPSVDRPGGEDSIRAVVIGRAVQAAAASGERVML